MSGINPNQDKIDSSQVPLFHPSKAGATSSFGVASSSMPKTASGSKSSTTRDLLTNVYDQNVIDRAGVKLSAMAKGLKTGLAWTGFVGGELIGGLVFAIPTALALAITMPTNYIEKKGGRHIATAIDIITFVPRVALLALTFVGEKIMKLSLNLNPKFDKFEVEYYADNEKYSLKEVCKDFRIAFERGFGKDPTKVSEFLNRVFQ